MSYFLRWFSWGDEIKYLVGVGDKSLASVQQIEMKKNESLSLYKRRLKRVGLIHLTNSGEKRKYKGSKFSREQRTRGERNHAHNPRDDNYFVPLVDNERPQIFATKSCFFII